MILSMVLLRRGRLKIIIMILLQFEALYNICENFNNFQLSEFMCKGFITSIIYVYTTVLRNFSFHMRKQTSNVSSTNMCMHM